MPLFLQQRQNGTVTITDARMTRFWITVEQGAAFVVGAIELMHGGEIFVPKIPSMSVVDLANVVAPDCHVRTIGIRAGEKLHEVLVSEDEARQAVELDDMFVVLPAHPWWNVQDWAVGKSLVEGFRYSSDTNTWRLSADDLRVLVEGLA